MPRFYHVLFGDERSSIWSYSSHCIYKELTYITRRMVHLSWRSLCFYFMPLPNSHEPENRLVKVIATADTSLDRKVTFLTPLQLLWSAHTGFLEASAGLGVGQSVRFLPSARFSLQPGLKSAPCLKHQQPGGITGQMLESKKLGKHMEKKGKKKKKVFRCERC